MGFHRGPKITTDGLVLALDAANHKSYPGSGDTIYDLVGSNNGNFNDGPTFNSNHNGSLVFDGVNDYIDLGDLSLISSDFCISIWVEMTENREHYFFSTGYNDAGSILIFSDGVWLNSASSDGRFSGNPGRVLNEIINITVERTGSTAKWYKNGVFQSSLSYSGAISTNTNYVIGWAIPRNKSTAYFKGNFYALHIYNKGFTSDEVTQNYNALKSRFGL